MRSAGLWGVVQIPHRCRFVGAGVVVAVLAVGGVENAGDGAQSGVGDLGADGGLAPGPVAFISLSSASVSLAPSR
jgi:hypothetical protein